MNTVYSVPLNACLFEGDINRCLEQLPASVVCALKSRPNKICVAGGFIRAVLAKETVKDIDIFVDSEQTARDVAAELRKPGVTNLETGKAITVLGYTVAPQVIYKWLFEHPRDVIEAFDFTIAQASFWWDCDHWTSHIHLDFYPDLQTKTLVYTDPRDNDDAGTFLRVLKFYRAGYGIDNDTLGKVLAGLCRGTSPEALLGTEEFLAQSFSRRFPHSSNGKY
jgi:hypothetical protein